MLARLASASASPLLDTAIYHRQQAAEKAVKGFLVFHNVTFPKTHDIKSLLVSAESVEPKFSAWREAAIN